MSTIVNSLEYWEERFKGDWQKKMGSQQTKFFAELLCSELPKALINEIKDNDYTICDVGCALGEAVSTYSKFFQKTVDGTDFSEEAIDQAKTLNNRSNFFVSDIEKNDADYIYDVIISSNVAEHFSNPWDIIRNMKAHASKYLVLMIPFKETIQIDEHEYIFNFNNMFTEIDGYKLVFSSLINGRTIENTLYADNQIILIYSCDYKDFGNAHLFGLIKEEINYMNELVKSKVRLIDVLDNEKNSIINEKEHVLSELDLVKKTREIENKKHKEIVDNFVEEVNKINLEVKKLEIDLEKSSNQINGLVEDVNRLNSENENYKLNQVKLIDENKNLKLDQVKLIDENKNLKLDQVKLIDENKNLKLDRVKLIDENKNYKLDQIKLTDENESFTLEIRQLKQNIELLNKEINSLNKALEVSNVEIDNHRLNDDYSRTLIYNLQVELNDIKNSLTWKICLVIRKISTVLGIASISQKLKNVKSLSNQGMSKKEIIYNRLKNSRYKKFLKRIIPSKMRQEYFSKYYNPNSTILWSGAQDIFSLIKEYDNMWSNEEILFVFSGVKFVESEGQRGIRLVQEAKKRNVKVIFAYWRWDSNEELEPSSSEMLQIPIDVLTQHYTEFFGKYFSSNTKKTLLVEFPHPAATDIVSVANCHDWVTAYDIIDEWEEFAKHGQAPWYNKQVEEMLVAQTDVRVATAQTLIDKFSFVPNDKWIKIGNGVNVDKIQKSKKLSEYDFCSGDLQIGYFGHLTDSWFNWDMIKFFAKKHPNWTFHIIGYGAPEDLKTPDNIRMYGKVEHSKLAAYAAYWDVAIIPFINCDLTLAVNPIKVYEYLQLGVPVVSSNMPEIGDYPYTKITMNQKEFEKAIVEMSKLKVDDAVIKTFINKHTWERKFDDFWSGITNFDKNKTYKIIFSKED